MMASLQTLKETEGRRHKGFTLVELLVSLVIVAILLLLLIPVVQSARESVNNATCVTHLRSIASAANIYALERGHYPPSRAPWGTEEQGTLWRQYLMPYFERDIDLYQGMDVYVCPSRVVLPTEPEDELLPSYALHSTICPDVATKRPGGVEDWSYVRPLNLQRPSEIILVGDATQQSSGQSHSNFWGMQEMLNADSGDPNRADEPVTVYEELDPFNGGAVFRYRHNGRANVAFVDGHVESRERGKILERNVRINY